MRFRNRQVCLWKQGGADELFTVEKRVFFQHYKGDRLASIYIPNEGFKTVKLSELHHLDGVTA